MSAETEDTPAPGKLSKAEANKENSRFLRGTVAEELRSDSACFNSANGGLLKFHGTYQQDDRDQRTASTTGGKSDKAYIFMVRSKIPGGRLTRSSSWPSSTCATNWATTRCGSPVARACSFTASSRRT